ncbi:hypothetical protein HYR99_23265 [Candidatus Poribacteria bacterium]|nr:hypothetical protein [Candidatus Poribacteria bacterium]
MKRTIQTMELAVELEVPIVVLHLGEVDTYDRSHLMYDLYAYGEREFEAFNKKVAEATSWRERKQAKHQDAVMFSLDTLNELALRLNLYLAIENRPRYYQIPNFDEVEPSKTSRDIIPPALGTSTSKKLWRRFRPMF